MPGKAGRLSIVAHRAHVPSYVALSTQQVYSVVEVEEFGRLQTSPAPQPEWEEELTLEIGPHASRLKVCLYQEELPGLATGPGPEGAQAEAQQPGEAPAEQHGIQQQEGQQQQGQQDQGQGQQGGGAEHRLLGQGSFSLEELFSEDTPDKLEHVQIPLVNRVYKNVGQLVCSIRYFHARTPGKYRDPLGREQIDEHLVSSGPKEGPRKVNANSPVASPRFSNSRPGSPMVPTPRMEASPLTNASS